MLLASGADGELLVTNASHEGGLEVRFAGVRAQRRRRTAKAHRAAIEYRDAAAQFFDVGENVRGEKQRAALGSEAAQHALHGDARRRVESAHRLIEQVEIA